MRLERLELRNFRCFETLDLDFDQTTVLVGANDTGKSTVLEAIHFLLSPRSSAVEWHEVVRRPYPRGEPIPEASVVGALTDLTAGEQDLFGPLALDGRLRLGRKSGDKDLWLLLTESQLRATIELFESEPSREYFGADDFDSIAARLAFADEVTELGGKFWLKAAAIWEFSSQLVFLDWFDSHVVPVIALGGPQDTAWSPRSVVEPILRRRFTRSSFPVWGREEDPFLSAVEEARTTLQEAIDPFFASLSRAHTDSLASTAPSFRSVRWRARLDSAALVEAIARQMTASVVRSGPDVEGSTSDADEVQVAALGPGAQRALALAALELYRETDLWSIGGVAGPSLALLLVEEPETGLHPAAQRAVARALREWSTFGLQLVLVTHSPTFVNAAPPEGVRLARRDPSSGEVDVSRAAALDEIRSSLGVQPADILLARRFVIVEGDSDRAIIEIWARKLGVDLAGASVQLVPSGGYSAVERVTRFLTLAYEGADFLVVLDNGVDTAKAKIEIESRFSPRVETALLTRTDIEAFFTAQAVASWLLLAGADSDDLLATVTTTFDETNSRTKALRLLSQRHLARSYDKLRDGITIAGLTREEEVHPEVVGLIQTAIRD